MLINRRNFIVLPALALGAGVGSRFAMAASDACVDTPLALDLLRLRGSDGTLTDAQLDGASWERADCRAGAACARVVLHGFVPAASSATHSVLVQTLFAGVDGTHASGNVHDLYRYATSTSVAPSKAVGFDAVNGAFSGFRLHVTQRKGQAARVLQVATPNLSAGLYAVPLVARSPQAYRFSGNRMQPLIAVAGATPHYLAFSVVEQA
jgi:hypothetical protein